MLTAKYRLQTSLLTLGWEEKPSGGEGGCPCVPPPSSWHWGWKGWAGWEKDAGNGMGMSITHTAPERCWYAPELWVHWSVGGGLRTPLCHCSWKHSRPSFLTVQLENSKEQSAISGVGEKHPPPPRPALSSGHRGTAVKDGGRITAPPPPPSSGDRRCAGSPATHRAAPQCVPWKSNRIFFLPQFFKIKC